MQQDHWDHLFEDEPVAGDTQQVVQVGELAFGNGGEGRSVMHFNGVFLEHHKVVVTVPWKRQTTERTKPVRIRQACVRCGVTFGAVRGSRTCSKPCYQAMYRERMRNG